MNLLMMNCWSIVFSDYQVVRIVAPTAADALVIFGINYPMFRPRKMVWIGTSVAEAENTKPTEENCSPGYVDSEGKVS